MSVSYFKIEKFGYIASLWLCCLANFFALLVVVHLISQKNSPYTLSLVQIDDFHKGFNKINVDTTPCRSNMTSCIEGLSKTYADVEYLRSALPNPIILNADGDFIGKLDHKSSQWNVIKNFMNSMNFDAVTVGSHNFVNGVQGLVPFMRALKAPFVLSNVNAIAESNFESTHLKSVVLSRQDKLIGIMSILQKETMQMSDLGKLQLLDEVRSVRREANYLKNEKHCDIIIVMSHCGKEVNERIAKEGGPYISIVVGGHSHNVNNNENKSKGVNEATTEFSSVITQEDGHKVLVIQSLDPTKFLNHLTVQFDGNNEVVVWKDSFQTKNNFTSMNLTQKVDPFDDLFEEKPRVEEVDMFAVVGKTESYLSTIECKSGECKLGSYLADSMLDGWNSEGRPLVNIAIVNGGAFRDDIKSGEIFYMDLIEAMPLKDQLVSFEILGKDLLKTLEFACTSREGKQPIYFTNNLLQVSGIQYVINVTNPNHHRVMFARIRCEGCKEKEFEVLSMEKTYRIVAPESFLKDIDGFGELPKVSKNVIRNGPNLFDSFLNYIKKDKIIRLPKTRRIIVQY